MLPSAVGSDFYLHDYLTRRTPKRREENGHPSGGGGVGEEGDGDGNQEPLGKSGKR